MSFGLNLSVRRGEPGAECWSGMTDDYLRPVTRRHGGTSNESQAINATGPSTTRLNSSKSVIQRRTQIPHRRNRSVKQSPAPPVYEHYLIRSYKLRQSPSDIARECESAQRLESQADQPIAFELRIYGEIMPPAGRMRQYRPPPLPGPARSTHRRTSPACAPLS